MSLLKRLPRFVQIRSSELAQDGGRVGAMGPDAAGVTAVAGAIVGATVAGTLATTGVTVVVVTTTI